MPEYIDLNGGLARIRGNKKMYKRMLGLFLASPEFDNFEKSLAEGDLAHASEVAHAIKGMTGNLSLDMVSTLSAALMGQLKAGERNEETLAEYRDALEKTKQAVNETIAQLDAEINA